MSDFDPYHKGYTDPFDERLPTEARVRHRRTVSIEPRQAVAVGFDSPAAVVDACRDWTTRWEVSLPEHGYRREQLLTPPALDPSFDFLETKTGEGVDGRALELGPTTEGYQHRTVPQSPDIYGQRLARPSAGPIGVGHRDRVAVPTASGREQPPSVVIGQRVGIDDRGIVELAIFPRQQSSGEVEGVGDIVRLWAATCRVPSQSPNARPFLPRPR